MVLVRAIASGISQGTELLLYRGEGPTPFDPSLGQDATPPVTTYPRRYGYAWIGEVVALGAGVRTPELGTRVFALAPHGDLHALQADTARAIDPSIPAARAVLAANVETAITCVWDSGLSFGDDVVVLGGGVVGILTGWLATAAGARVRLVEPSKRRRDAARALGVRDALTPEDDNPRGDADVVVEATGDPCSLDRAIAHAACEATVCVASFYGIRTYAVGLGNEFHRRRLVLRATQVSTIPAAHAPRWTLARRFDLVRRLLDDPRLDALLEDPVPFDEAARAYARLDATPGELGQVTFDYR